MHPVTATASGSEETFCACTKLETILGAKIMFVSSIHRTKRNYRSTAPCLLRVRVGENIGVRSDSCCEIRRIAAL